MAENNECVSFGPNDAAVPTSCEENVSHVDRFEALGREMEGKDVDCRGFDRGRRWSSGDVDGFLTWDCTAVQQPVPDYTAIGESEREVSSSLGKEMRVIFHSERIVLRRVDFHE